MPIASNWPARACASGRLHPETNVCAEARLAAPSARRPWITAGSATAQWKARSARRYPPPHDPSSHAEPSSHFAEAQLHARLTNPAKQNIITSIRGSRRQVADFKSEPRPASNRNQWPASYWNAWPASSESAIVEWNFARHLEKFGEAVERVRLAGQRRRQSFKIEEESTRTGFGVVTLAAAVLRRIVAGVSEINPCHPARQMLDPQVRPTLFLR